MKKIMLLYLILSSSLQAQDSPRWVINHGFAFSPPEIIRTSGNMDHTDDNEFFINALYHIPLIKNLKTNVGAGIAMIANDVNYLINSRYFDVHNKRGYHSNKYYNTLLQPQAEIQYQWLESGSGIKMLTGIGGVVNISVLKKIIGFHGGDFHKAKFNMNNLEAFAQVVIGYRQLLLKSEYRIYNMKYRDDALITDLHSLVTSIPNKWKFTLGIAF